MQQDVVYFSQDKRVSLTAYIQPQCSELPTQQALPAVIILPGGGYKMLSQRESDPVAFAWLAKGYNVFILRYSIQEHAAFPQPMLMPSKRLLMFVSSIKTTILTLIKLPCWAFRLVGT